MSTKEGRYQGKTVIQEILGELKKLNNKVAAIENIISAHPNIAVGNQTRGEELPVEEGIFNGGIYEDVVLWKRVKEVMKIDLAEIPYNTWIKDMELVRIEEDVVFLKSTSNFNKLVVEERYMNLVSKAFKFFTENDYKIIIEV